ncbi:hypothetical protein [Acinetobacter baumannii]|uniref:hypothetical protein n=1 Tax=Acinetobacter baumannii TaxID=470 RepID=UPI0020236F80|nr:hypothetical protein [Acinetobacter baumannii]MCL8264244.1 hypothetical protein [Acinetobacter baumannii]
MWNYLTCFSTWAENNSGQIQIVIGFLAFFLAYKGYKKLLEQIEISNKQEKEGEKTRFYELKLNLIKAVNDESSKVQLLHDEFLNSVDTYFMCRQNFSISSSELNQDINSFFEEVLSDRGLKNLDVLKKRMEFLDDTFIQIRNPNLRTEHIEKILNKIFESDLIIEQIKSDLSRMRHLVDSIKCFGKELNN